MRNVKDDTLVINSHRASNPQAAVIDAQRRSLEALTKYPQFFNSDHMVRVQQVKQVLRDFFRVSTGTYVTHRENGGKPFTTVKAERVQWDLYMQKHKQSKYLQPILALGGEIVEAKGTHSVLVRIRT